MIRLKRIKPNGDIETIYKNENLSTVECYLDLVIKRNNLFTKKVHQVRFIDGCKGIAITKENGNIIQYKIEA